MRAHLMTWLRLREMSTSDRLFSAMLVACASITRLARLALRLKPQDSVQHHGWPASGWPICKPLPKRTTLAV